MKQNKFTKSARGEDCAFRIPNVCSYDSDKTILCHLPDDSGTGRMGGKSADWCAAFGCYECHKLIDNQAEFLKTFTSEDYLFFIRRAMIRTWSKWIETGVIKV